MIHIVTLFAQNYMARGLAMIESVRKHSTSAVRFTVLAMDQNTFNFLLPLKSENFELLHLNDFIDFEFQELRSLRPFRELCWTAASCLTKYVFESDKSSEYVIYIDSDCYFFDDITKLIEKWNPKSNIFIHEHRFSVNRMQWEASAGRFNVGVVGFRGNSSEAGRCLARWRSQVLSICELNPELGLCGDQGYLNEWPIIYPGLQIMSGVGEGAAPWNVEYLESKKIGNRVLISDGDLIFYHFHSLKMAFNLKLRLMWTQMAYGYQIPTSIKSNVYQPYLKHIKKIIRNLRNNGHSLESLGLEGMGIKDLIRCDNPRQHILQLLA